MAASPQPTTLKKDKKDESFLDKIGGTLSRKKKVKEGSLFHYSVIVIHFRWCLGMEGAFLGTGRVMFTLYGYFRFQIGINKYRCFYVFLENKG